MAIVLARGEQASVELRALERLSASGTGDFATSAAGSSETDSPGRLRERLTRSSMFDRVRRRRRGFKTQLATLVDRAIAEKRWRDPTVRQVVRHFHRIYYSARGRTWRNTFWRGVPVQKCPLDLWVYKEIIHEVRPDLIVEAGTYQGGSAYDLASICDLLNHGRVVTIDIDPRPPRPEHTRITYLTGSSTDPGVVASVDKLIPSGSRIMVILDSDPLARARPGGTVIRLRGGMALGPGRPWRNGFLAIRASAAARHGRSSS